MRGIATLMSRSRNSYMRAWRSVTLQPIATLSRTLKLATDFLALHCTGFWPLIFARSPMRALEHLAVRERFADAHVDRDLRDPRHGHRIRDPSCFMSWGTTSFCRTLAVLAAISSIQHFAVDLKKRTLRPSASLAEADAIRLLRRRVEQHHVRRIERLLLLDDAAAARFAGSAADASWRRSSSRRRRCPSGYTRSTLPRRPLSLPAIDDDFIALV
jgi:hypothetical protein